MKKNILSFLLICMFANLQMFIFAQSVAINNDGATAHSSAILDVKSTTKGILAPRMTTVQRTAIGTPAAGLLVYDTDTNSYWCYNGTIWSSLSASGIGGSGTTNFISKFITANTIGSSQIFDNGTNIGINTASPFGKLHIKGSADAPQLIIDANATQSNTNPLISLRRSDGVNLMWIHSDNPFNTFIGLYSGVVNNAAGGGLYNTFMGRDAGASNTTGYANSAHGFQALQLDTTGVGNTASGVGAIQNNTVGNENTAFGAEALQFNTQSQNSAMGFKALWLNTTGGSNTANGHSALMNNTNGDQNCATGAQALYNNINGNANTANGYRALYNTSNGSYNTATGFQALLSNTEGQFNTANGIFSLNLNTIGNQNTAIGAQSLFHNSTANRNTAIGVNALYTQSFSNGDVSWESSNVAVGYNALYFNQPTNFSNGIQNTAVGAYALQANTEGQYNTALGNSSLVSNTKGQANTGTGYGTLYHNLTGSFNLAAGMQALNNNTTGSDNIAIGFLALTNNTGGSGNIAIGTYSGTDPGSPNTSNTISIGNNNILNAASNQALIGNTSIAWIGGQVGWFHYSDARIKTNIKEEVKGLDFILRLRPVTYNKNLQKMREITGNKESKDFPGKYDIEKIKFSGFLAQEVEKAAKESGYDFDGVHKPQNEHDLYSLSYAEFVVPLVKGMQEQQAIIEEQNKKIELLIKEIELMKVKLK